MGVVPLALLVTLAALWGGSFVFMRVAVPALGAIPLAYVRVAIAAVLLLGIAFAQRRIPPFRTRWKEFLVVGVVNSAIPFSLFCYAELHISASAGAVLNATSPFFATIAGAIWLSQPATRTKLAGIALGLTGVVVLVGLQPGAASDDVLLAVAACLVAAICYALAGVYTKRTLSDVPSQSIACASQVFAALALMPLLPFTTIPGPLTGVVVANVIGLAVGSTAIAYLIYFKLIADVGPQRALTVTFLIPLFGVLWGALFLGEPLTRSLLLGGALVIAGTFVTVRGR
ncbi:MAG: EamA family transporter [Burkholderiales bacterium]